MEPWKDIVHAWNPKRIFLEVLLRAKCKQNITRRLQTPELALNLKPD